MYIAKEYYDRKVPIETLTKQEKNTFKTQKNCHICERSLVVLPPTVAKKLQNTKKAIDYYKDDKKSVHF